MKLGGDQERPRFLTDENFSLRIVAGLRDVCPRMDLLTLRIGTSPSGCSVRPRRLPRASPKGLPGPVNACGVNACGVNACGVNACGVNVARRGLVAV
jgi:hypothetical protein